MRTILPLQVLLLTLGLGGCAGVASRRGTTLPFHVAVIPLTARSLHVDPVPGTAPESERFGLELDAAAISSSVASSLTGTCFSRVSLLSLPDGVGAAEFDSWSTAERDAHWARAAEDRGADVVLECDVRYSPAVRDERNGKFWLNLPLFLLGGPACWFVDDVSYVVDASLQANLYDVNAIRSGRATFQDGRAELLHVESHADEATMDFIDRAGGQVGWYAASVVVPAGFLHRESENAEHKVAGEVASVLAADFARAVREGSRELLVADHLTGFHLDPEYSIDLAGGRIRFRGTAILRRGDIERMESFTVRAGTEAVTREFETGEPDRRISTMRTRYVRYPFGVDLPDDPRVDRLVVELSAGGQSPAARTFTIPLPGGRSSAPRPANLARR
jgi:hypothetical protein